MKNSLERGMIKIEKYEDENFNFLSKTAKACKIWSQNFKHHKISLSEKMNNSTLFLPTIRFQLYDMNSHKNSGCIDFVPCTVNI